MKKIYLLIAALMVVGMTSMMLIEKKDQQKTWSGTIPEWFSPLLIGLF